MTSMSMQSAGDEIAELRNKIEKLEALVGTSKSTRRRAVRRPMALVATAVLAVGMLAGVAGASGTTTNVSFVALSPAKLLLSNVSIVSKKTNSPVVIGGATTVPSDATTVELQVSAKSATAGTLDFYPALNPTGGSGQTLAYPSGNVLATATIQENVGQSGEVTIYNAGSATAVVTVKILGYSTQVTAGDINGVGGTAGQVLTNDGNGGTSWQTVGPSVSSKNGSRHIGYYAPSIVDAVNLHAGAYHVVGTYNLSSTTVDIADCFLQAPDGSNGVVTFGVVGTPYAGAYYGSGTTQALMNLSSAGTVYLYCYGTLNAAGATAVSDTLVANQVGSASGSGVVN